MYQWTLLIAAWSQRSALWNAPRFVPADKEQAGEPAAPETPPAIVILVPSHNEELLLPAMLGSLSQLRYPSDRLKIVVVADNCTDSTAEIAARRGAIVFGRTDADRPGKGYALQDAVDLLLGRPCLQITAQITPDVDFDAVVILDADSIVHPDLLTHFARRLTHGGAALQACYAVSNPMESVRTRWMTCALALAHLIKPAGRERLRLSAGLKGNGMGFSRRAIQDVPWSGESITEDLEYTIRLCEAGIRVEFVPQAILWAQMPAAASAAAHQRRRWEGGRSRLARSLAPKLLAAAAKRRSRTQLELALDLVVPPVAQLAALLTLLTAASVVWWRRSPGTAVTMFFWVSASLALLHALYVVIGLWLARIPWSISRSLLYAPWYVVWKLGIVVFRALSPSNRAWKRTPRH